MNLITWTRATEAIQSGTTDPDGLYAGWTFQIDWASDKVRVRGWRDGHPDFTAHVERHDVARAVAEAVVIANLPPGKPDGDKLPCQSTPGGPCLRSMNEVCRDHG